jgi:hypothetical protein
MTCDHGELVDQRRMRIPVWVAHVRQEAVDSLLTCMNRSMSVRYPKRAA